MLNKVIRSGLHTLAVALAVRMQSSRIPVRRAQPVSTKATAEERLAKISSLKTRLKEIENITFTQPTYSSPNTFNDPIDLQLSTLEAVVEDPLKSDINYINNIHGDDEDDFVVFDKEFDKIDDSSAAHESDQHGRCSNVLDARVFTGLLDKEIRQLNEKAETILQRTRNIMCEMDKSGNEIVSSSSSKREYYDLRYVLCLFIDSSPINKVNYRVRSSQIPISKF
jgi:hypothetical protein